MDVMEKGMELGQQASPDSGIGVFGAAMAKMLDKIDLSKAGAPAGAQPEPAPAAVQPAAALPPGQEPTAEERIAAIHRQFFELTTVTFQKAAAREGDTELYAEWLIDQLPPTLDPYLESWFNDETYPANLLPYFPGVASQWLGAVLLEVRERLTESPEVVTDGVQAVAVVHHDASPSTGRPGDVPDTPPNEAAGQ